MNYLSREVERKMNTKLLTSILSQPAAPYRESHVRSTISAALKKSGVAHFEDPIGNLIVGVESADAYRARLQKVSSEPVRVFVAHMDHPGFHGVKWRNDRELEVKWYGGSPTRHLNGAKVWLADNEGWQGEGVLAQAKLLKSGAALDTARVKFKKPIGLGAEDLFGGFKFRKPVWRQGDNLYTKAADDLVGAFAVTSLAQEIKGSEDFIGVLTRAEEVGFIGWLGHLELGWLRSASRRIVCISLETSRTLPGAIIGKGPVLRQGDRATTFDAGALQVFSRVALKHLKGKYQRRVMDGGTCEATVAVANGFPTVGISIPLGNYHNQCFEGGPDSRGPLGPAPEFVNVKDIQGMLKLCHALLDKGLAWEDPWAERRLDFQASLEKARPLLQLR